MRKSFEKIYMQLATDFSTRSTCKRLHVGTVITSSDYRYVYGVGYNGSASGLSHNCNGLPGLCGCIHSECNSIINCTVPRQFKKIVFVTHLPCPMCAKMLVNLGGVTKIIYKNNYRNKESIRIFKNAKIRLIKE